MRHKIYHRKSCKYMSQETRDISLDGEVHVSEDPDVMDTDECPEEGDEALQVEEEPCEPTEPTEAEPSLELPSRAELRAAVAMDSHEPPRERATTTARGLRNTWVDVTPGMSWHERESAERKAHGKNWKMDTSLKLPSRAELRAAVAMDSHEPPRERATTMARGLRNTWVDVTPGMSWHERERAERKAHGKSWKMDTSLKRPSRAELRAAVAMDSYEPPRERATTMTRGLRNTWVDVTPGMSWDERESAERKAHGKSWKMDTSLKAS